MHFGAEPAGYQLDKSAEVDVTSAQQNADTLVRHRNDTAERGGEREATCGLHDDLQAFGKQGHRCREARVCNGDDVADSPLYDREVMTTNMRDERSVRNRARRGDVNDVPAAQGLPAIVARLG